MTAKAATLDVLTAFRVAKAEDLEQIRENIAELERELDTLHIIERALNIRIHGKPERKKPEKRKTTGGRVLHGFQRPDHRSADRPLPRSAGRPLQAVSDRRGPAAQPHERVGDSLGQSGPLREDARRLALGGAVN